MPLVLLTCDTCGDRVIIDAASVADARRRAANVEAWTYDDDRDTCPQHDERIDARDRTHDLPPVRRAARRR